MCFNYINSMMRRMWRVSIIITLLIMTNLLTVF